MPKPKHKPLKKAAAAKRPLRAPKKTKPRMREATHAKPTKKARPAMTAAASEHRGAGSGENAVHTRSRQYNEKATEYPKGDIAKGRIDYEQLSEGQTAEQIAMRDRRAYLIDQAEKNEAANDELNAIQVDQNKRVQFVQNQLQDPDEMRESSMETAVAALKMHDPDERKKQVEAAQKQREKDAKTGAKTAGNPNTPDFKAGQVAG